jgi:plastocyanin
MNNKTLGGLIALVLLSIGVYLFIFRQPVTEPVRVNQGMPAVTSGGNANPENSGEKTLSAEQGILISNFSFEPKEVRVKAGTKIVWTNDDSVGHTVTSDEGRFDSQLLARGQKFEFIFSEKGTFAYHCRPHPNMKATVIVE